MPLLIDEQGATDDELAPDGAEHEDTVDEAEHEEAREAGERPAALAAAERLPEHRDQNDWRVDDVGEEDDRVDEDREQREDDEVRERGEDRVPEGDRNGGAKKAEAEEGAPVEAD